MMNDNIRYNSGYLLDHFLQVSEFQFTLLSELNSLLL